MTGDGPVAWLNGHVLPAADARLPVQDLGIVGGISVADMARTYGHRPFRMEQHVERLLASCRELGFPPVRPKQDLLDAAETIAEHNARNLPEGDDLGIVWFVTAGLNPTYTGDAGLSESTVCVHTFRLPLARWKPAVDSGVVLTIPEQKHLPEESFPVRHKTRSRIHWWLADRQAAAGRPGSRALLLDEQGRMTETATACFYAVRDGTVHTRLSGVLNSITRRIVRELCADLDIPFQFSDPDVAFLRQCEEAFLSSTPCGLLPVASIDEQHLAGPDGPVLKRLQAAWTQLTGIDTFAQIREAR